jgi:hypothetical protein
VTGVSRRTYFRFVLNPIYAKQQIDSDHYCGHTNRTNGVHDKNNVVQESCLQEYHKRVHDNAYSHRASGGSLCHVL